MEDIEKISSLTADKATPISRCVYVNILRSTEDPKVLETFIETGGWKIIYKWLDEAKAEDNISFLVELLKVYQQLPVTIELLKQNNCAKTIKQLGKINDDVVKELSADIVSKWMQKIRDASDSSGSGSGSSSGRPKKKAQANGNKKSDGKTDKSSKSAASGQHHMHGHHHTHGHHHRHRSNSDSDNNTDSNNKTTNKQNEVNNTNNAKPRAKTVKTPPTKFRSTGVEEESISPKRKVDKPAVKRVSTGSLNKAQQPPEKKSRANVLSAITTSMSATAATETHGKIKIIPPRPKVEIYESTGFMDALTLPPTSGVRRKRKGSIGQKTPATPTSPPSKSAVIPSFYKDTLESPDGEPEAKKQAEPPAEKNGDEPQPASTTVDGQDSTVEAAQNDDSSSQSTKEGSVPRSISPVSIASLVATSGKPMKKTVRWMPEEQLHEVFYFELDETERVNVNKRNFADSQRDELAIERKMFNARRGTTNDAMTESTQWRRPPGISGLDPNRVKPGCNSLQKDIQKQRVEGTLQTVYFTPDMIPECPSEPDTESPDTSDTSATKVIPLNDTTGGESTYEYTNMAMPAIPPGGVPGAVPGGPPNTAGGQLSLPSDVAGLLHNMAAQVQQQQYPQDGVNANIQNLMTNVMSEQGEYNGELTNRLHNILKPYQDTDEGHPDQHYMGPPDGPDHDRGGPYRPPRRGMDPGHMRGHPRGGPPPRGGPHGNHRGGPPGGPPMRGGPPPPMMRGRGGRGGPRPSVCTNFMGGYCHFDTRCHFLHPGVNAPPI